MLLHVSCFQKVAGWLTYAMPWRRSTIGLFPLLKLHVDFRMYIHMYCVSMWLEETFRFFDGTCHAMVECMCALRVYVRRG